MCCKNNDRTSTGSGTSNSSEVDIQYQRYFVELDRTHDSSFIKGVDGVKAIYTPKDGKTEFIVYKDKTLVCVKSTLGYPAIYPLKQPQFKAPAKAVLMDLDGTSVRSEKFWMWIIERTIAKLLDKSNFQLSVEDEPHVSGYSVSEHLQYCIDKYCPEKTLELARKYYFEITNSEMKKIIDGNGRDDAFVPSPGLKDFLLELKAHDIKIGLVTSGLYEKAWPEIVSAFRTLGMPDPKEFYDSIITAGFQVKKGDVGTLGELSPKPHPWLYAEVARVGLGLDPSENQRVIGIEDSGAGVLSVRLAGFSVIGIEGGNIETGGLDCLLYRKYNNLLDALPIILGE